MAADARFLDDAAAGRRGAASELRLHLLSPEGVKAAELEDKEEAKEELAGKVDKMVVCPAYGVVPGYDDAVVAACGAFDQPAKLFKCKALSSRLEVTISERAVDC